MSGAMGEDSEEGGSDCIIILVQPIEVENKQ